MHIQPLTIPARLNPPAVASTGLPPSAAQLPNAVQAPDLDPSAFRRVLGHFVTGVTVVTSGAPGGRLAALTANAFTSVSLEPPLILICVDQRSRSLDVLRETGRFAVHILTETQKELALTLARRGKDKLEAVDFQRGTLGLPVLAEYLALLECDLVSDYPGGDHRILVGEVRRCDLGGDSESPLTFFRGTLGTSAGLDAEARP